LKVAIVGFGMMGRQIAQVFLQNGHQVTVTDENLNMLKPGVEEVENGPYGIKAAVSRGKLTEVEAADALRNLRVAEDLQEACTEAGLVIEAVFENLNLKQRLFQQIELAAPSSAMLASNTSTLSLAKIAEKVREKERVLGLHFFNPAQATKLVEIVRTDKTSPTRLEEAVNIVKQFGKTPIISEDEPGFVANRLGLTLYVEASRLLEQGTASVEDIDTAMRLGYGHPMGPFQTADLVGLDTRLRNLESLYEATGDTKWIPPRILREMVNQGYTGDPSRKKGSKGGYYELYNVTPQVDR
jgi:3-hydroxybutyryl-CoA dehydrogenase